MRTPALAIGWAIWCQHRRGLIACTVALVVMIVVYPFVFSITRSPAVVTASTVPLIFVFGFVLNSLLVVEDPGSLTSSSPRHRFVFPVRTHTLVFWPMFYGWSVSGLLWLAAAGLIYRLNGFPTPLVLPALATGTLMAWVQAIAWLPLPKSWIRAMTILMLGALAALPLWLIYSELISPAFVAVLLIAYGAMAYPLALLAVASDRRGEVWLVWPASFGRDGSAAASALSSPRRAFRSASGAQFWYEWRCHGLVLPGGIALILILILCMLVQIALTARRPTSPILFPILLTVVILLPLIMAGSAGPGMGRLAPMFSPKSGRFITFLAIRPMTTGALVAAKFRMALASALLTWAVVVALAATWIISAGNTLGLATGARAFFQPYANLKGLALIGLGAMLLPALTWKQMTSGFSASLSGRRWIADCVALAYVPVFAAFFAGGIWAVEHPEAIRRIFAIIPYLVVCAAIPKATIALVTFRSALRRGLVTWPTVGGVLLIWLAMSACGFACVSLMSSTSPLAISQPVALLGILAFMPLSRFALAPVALDWNRHR